jgi:hypothetical protein
MIGENMLDIEIDQKEIVSKTPVWPQQPAEMYVRFWPDSWQGGNSFNSVFRYRLGTQRMEHVVRIERWRREVPLTPAQYRLWDSLRTELVLTPRTDQWHVWTGMTLLPQTIDRPNDQRWDQSHVFFIIRNQTKGRWEHLVDQHYNTISFRGHWNETQHYLDWKMTSRNPIAWDEL